MQIYPAAWQQPYLDSFSLLIIGASPESRLPTELAGLLSAGLGAIQLLPQTPTGPGPAAAACGRFS